MRGNRPRSRNYQLAGMTHARILRRVAIPVTALILVGCHGAVFRTSFHLEKGDVAKLRAEGSQPEVRVENRGPGQVEIEFASPPGTDKLERLGPGSVTRATRGPMSLRLENVDDIHAEVLVEVKRAIGLEIEQIPLPR